MANSGVVALNAGFDIGSENCYIGVAKGGGIEIILNDYSQRSTPSYVALGDKQRELGVSAKQKQLMNIQSTFYALKRLIGRQFNDVASTEGLPFPIEVGEHGDVVVKVNHNGEDMTFSATQLLAMLLTKLKVIAEGSVDVVLNCPSYFTDAQRRSLADAAVIAGLNPLRILPDLTAVGIFYGFYRAYSSPDINVAFIDVGHTTTQISVVNFRNRNGTGMMTVLDVQSDCHLGGKDLDELLANYFIEEKKLTLNKRSKLRLLAACEKLKMQMSANSNRLPIGIECLYEEKDFSSFMDRALFEQLASSFFARVENLMRLCLEKSHEKFLLLQKGEEKPVDFVVGAVEIVGGSSRVAAIKRIAKEVFGQEPTTTLNADEAVARGCALQCAMLSPTCKVKEFQVTDFAQYPVSCKYWFETGEADPKVYELKLFPRGHPYPFTRKITLNCSVLPLVFELEYTNDQNQVVPIGQYKIVSPQPLELHKNKLTILVRLDPSGIAHVNSASVLFEDKSIPNGVPSEAPQPMETESNGPANGSSEGDQKKAETKSKTISHSLVVETKWVRGKLTDEELQLQREIEYNLILADKNWKERIDARNELEEFVYEWRSKMEDGRYDQFIDGHGKNAFLSDLNAAEKWLYEEEATQSKGVYFEKLDALKKQYSNQLVFRLREFEERESLLERLGKTIQLGKKLLEKRTETEQQESIKLDDAKVAKLDTECAQMSVWFDEAHAYFNSLMLTQDPEITTKIIREKTEQLESVTRPVVDDLQRKRDEKKRKEEEESKKKASNDSAGNATTEAPQQPMDVDPQPASQE